MKLEDCSYRHRFRFLGRYKGHGDGVNEPSYGDLVWMSDFHEPPAADGALWHAYAMSPDKFWRRPA